jgi:S-formylglutathione hydrolase FrmB
MRLVNIPRIGVSVGEGRDRVFCDERFAEPPSMRESTGSRVMTNSTKRFTSILICALVLSGTISAKTDGTRVFEISFFSGVLQREMPVSIVAPSARSIDAPVLVLLHGRGRNHRSLVDVESSREQLLAADIWVILPQGEDGWYINSPVRSVDRYEDYLDEVLTVVKNEFKLTPPPIQWAITGWSMGGYGAMRYATRHPEEFNSVSAMIGLLDFPREANLPVGQNYEVPGARFGQDRTVWSDYNPIHAVAALRGKPVMLITADAAFDRTMNENFSAALVAQKIGHQIITLEGGHTFEVVQNALPLVLEFVRETTSPATRR